jgi:hypothetical protein
MNPLKQFFQNSEKRTGLISRLLQVALVIILIVATIYISGPLPEKDARGRIITPQPTLTSSAQTENVNSNAEIFEKTPTSGVILAGFGVLLILLVGTAISIHAQK